jgi:SAM-dependent methyltransferase
MTADVREADFARQFDVIVLPDVIDHIPQHDHDVLFEKIATWVRPEGFVLLHYPNPYYKEWLRDNSSDSYLRQVSIAPIHGDVLLSRAYRAGLCLDYLERYAIWIAEGDYVCAVLRPVAGVRAIRYTTPVKQPLLSRMRARLRRAPLGA